MQHKGHKTELAGKGTNKIAGNVPPKSIPVAIGLNDNLDFMGKQLHVQTESMKSPAMRIVTQVFCNGRVLFSTKSDYPAGIRESQSFSQIQDLMRAQHFKVIEKIRDKKAQILGSS
jgi:hypothetical protein